VAAGLFLDDDPDRALGHARAARELAPRIGLVRETLGLTAYRAGEWAEAARELRAAKRMTGDPVLLPVIADCERALGRPERAIELSHGVEAGRLPLPARQELAIVEAGARRDLGQPEAALLVLRDVGLGEPDRPRSARLAYAYADALEAVGRTDEAIVWFRAALSADIDGETDAEERLAVLGDDQLDGYPE
jgi:tetratricopeptide (TPR) repeat protein